MQEEEDPPELVAAREKLAALQASKRQSGGAGMSLPCRILAA